MGGYLSKLKELLTKLLQLKIHLKFTGNEPGTTHHINPILAYALVIIGAAGIAQIIANAYLSLLHPKIRRLYIRMVSKPKKQGKQRWVIVYGACNNVGSKLASVYLQQGYSLVLVDANLDKLQHLKNDLSRVFPLVGQPDGQHLEIVNINFAIWKDSTSIEQKIREIFNSSEGSGFREVAVMVNTSSLSNGAWQVCEDKLFHEVQFDQILAYLGNSLLGFSIILNFLSRLIVFNKQPCLVLNVLKQEVYPNDRTNLPMRILRMLYFPFYYHKLLQRMNLLHYSLNSYTRQLLAQASLGYPMLQTREIVVDTRIDRTIETTEIEMLLSEATQGLQY